MEFQNLKLELKDGGLALLTIQRPEKLNTLSTPTLVELAQAFDALALDGSVRGVILTGAGERAFVAGADIAELAAQDVQAGYLAARRGQQLFDRIEALGKPVIAAVNGVAVGGGCELALACHLRVAAEHARFGTPEVKLGLMCGFGGTQRLPRLVGRGRALELLLTGELVDAQEAVRIGLVNRVVPQPSLLAESERLLRTVLANAPLGVAYTLHAVAAGLDLPLRQAQELEAALFATLCSTADMREGTRAILEKRAARFQGK
jgi:enoyl-CoA hydratase